MPPKKTSEKAGLLRTEKARIAKGNKTLTDKNQTDDTELDNTTMEVNGSFEGIPLTTEVPFKC
jgi:hypothetical protein